MNISNDLNTPDYYEQLREFRDSALVASNWHGTRKKIGGFVFGTAIAGWRSQDGGIADLKHTGIRFKGSNITRIMPTTLRIISTNFSGNYDVTTFSMELDDVGCIDVFSNDYINAEWGEIVVAGISRANDLKNGIQKPTDYDRELVYTELQRGASGDFVTNRTH